MLAVVSRVGARIDSSPVSGKSGEMKLQTRGYKEEKSGVASEVARQLFHA
jgi:hypothetical protein